MKVKAKCARALIRYLKAKESERENSNELCTTKLYYATCRQRVCGQNKDNLCLQAARTLRARRTLIWRSCAFNRRPMTMPILDGPMTMPVLDGPMTMPVLDGVKPMAITLPIILKETKKAYIAGLGRDQLEHLASPMTKSESKYQRVQDKSETIEKRLEYYSPSYYWQC